MSLNKRCPVGAGHDEINRCPIRSGMTRKYIPGMTKERYSMKKSLLLLVFMSALLWTGCEQPIEPDEITDRPEEKTPKTLTVTIQAVKADAPDTKGLRIGDGLGEDFTEDLRSIWKAGEKVFVYKGTVKICELTMGENGNVIDEEDPRKATLTFTVPSDKIADQDQLTLLTPRTTWSYEGQTGVLLYNSNASPDNSIEKNFHYTMATVTATVSGSSVTFTTSPVKFHLQQSIYRLSFRYQAPMSDPNAENTNPKTPISTKSVTIAAARGGLVKTWSLDENEDPVVGDITVNRPATIVNDQPTWDTNPFFVALRNINTSVDEAFIFTVIDGDGVTYRGSRTILGDVNDNGKFISIKKATLNDRLDVPLNTSATGVTTVL